MIGLQSNSRAAGNTVNFSVGSPGDPAAYYSVTAPKSELILINSFSSAQISISSLHFIPGPLCKVSDQPLSFYMYSNISSVDARLFDTASFLALHFACPIFCGKSAFYHVCAAATVSKVTVVKRQAFFSGLKASIKCIKGKLLLHQAFQDISLLCCIT